MREGIVLSSVALGAALLVAAPPASAQQAAVRGGQDGFGAAAAPAGLSTAAQREPAALLQEAERAVRRGEMGRATELIERAETALLNTHGGAATTHGDDAPREARVAIGQARRAVFGGDRAQAQDRLRSALSVLEGGGMATGSSAAEPGRMGSTGGGPASARPD